MNPDEYEDTIAKSSAAGREALLVLRRARAKMDGVQKVEKSFELTEMTRQIMRAGLVAANPDLDEDEIQTLYVERILSYSGLSLAKIHEMQQAERLNASYHSPQE